jgi:large subunit ribosomal protein L1
MDIGKAVTDAKGGKIDFKVDKAGIIHTGIGRASFDAQKLTENAMEVLNAIVKLKPSSARGTYVRSVYMSSTMSAGIQIDPKTFN